MWHQNMLHWNNRRLISQAQSARQRGQSASPLMIRTPHLDKQMPVLQAVRARRAGVKHAEILGIYHAIFFKGRKR